MDQARTRAAAWVLWTSAVLLALAAFTFLILGAETAAPSESFAFRGFSAVFAIVFGTTGLLIASRVPSNPIGWMMLALGIGSGLQELSQQYAIYGILHRPGSLPWADVAAWTTQWAWIPLTALATVFIPMLFPTGQLLSRRWRPIALAAAALISIDAVAFAIVPGPLEEFRAVVNPFGVPGAAGLQEIAETGPLAYMLAVAAAITSLVMRHRRASREERLQLNWLVLAGSIAGIALIATFVAEVVIGSTPKVLEYVIVLAVAGIPVAIGVAILRYRLYAIDVVIKKTVVFAVLAVLLFAIGLPVVWVFGGIVAAIFGEDDAYAFLAGGIVIGAAIWPLGRLATRIADRLVYGRRATPYEVLSEFAGRVAETYAAEDVLQRMAQLLGEAVGAEAATVWLGVGRRAHPAATWPIGTAPDDELPASATEVRYQGTVLGALSVRMPARDPMTPARDRLIRDLAGQAGLVLRNATLIEDLRASRQRLVEAQDEERRRIERNIHDGAQQQLVALAVRLGLAERILPSDVERAAAMLAEAKAETNDALETLRDLARGIYPPLLADEGLTAALTAQARKSPLPVTVVSDGIGRLPKEIEAAVYFSCLEALQNAAKLAEASTATVTLARTDGQLTFEVADDGRGFDPAVVGHGTGLQGIADRLAALGADLVVRSAPGAGTTVVGDTPRGGVRLTPRAALRLAWSLWVVTPASLAAGVVIGVTTDTFRADGPFIVLMPAFLLTFATVGGLVASRRPGNAIGWLFLATSVAWSLVTVIDSYAIYADLSGNTGSTLAQVADWVNIWFYGIAIFLPVTLLFFLFPTGRVPSRRWRPFVWLGVAANVGVTVAEAFDPGAAGDDTYFLKENPFGIEALDPFLEVLAAVSWPIASIAVVASMIALVLRFRRSRGDEREQMKWVAYAAAVFVVVFVIQGIFGAIVGWRWGPVAEIVFPAAIIGSLTLIPLAAGAAILKQRLYDIDVVIQKTILFGILVLLIMAVAMGTFLATSSIVTDIAPDETLAVGLVGLALGVSVWPLYRLARRIADRLVFGGRSTPYEVLSGFADRIGGTYSAEDVLPRMAQLLGEATRADAARVWLRVGLELHVSATWPVDAAPRAAVPAVGDDLPTIAGEEAFEVRDRGEPLGALSIELPASDPMNPSKEKLARDLAKQAGLVLRNVRLIEELRESRRRIVAAQDERAKKLERNIHDGAQQQLVALAVKLGLVERLIGTDPGKAATLVADAKEATNDALEDLRDLARGIYPPLLADQGLAAALEAQARKAPIPVRIEAEGIGRYPQETEAAIYFSALEALQNTTKYAEASCATVRLAQANGTLTFEVFDDGLGFDPALVGRGTGLQGIADRLAALGGEVRVRSAPGEGTTVFGTVHVMPTGVVG